MNKDGRNLEERLLDLIRSGEIDPEDLGIGKDDEFASGAVASLSHLLAREARNRELKAQRVGVGAYLERKADLVRPARVDVDVFRRVLHHQVAERDDERDRHERTSHRKRRKYFKWGGDEKNVHAAARAAADSERVAAARARREEMTNRRQRSLRAIDHYDEGSDESDSGLWQKGNALSSADERDPPSPVAGESSTRKHQKRKRKRGYDE